MTMPKGFLEDLARAYDAECSASRGEPSPWREDLVRQYREERGIPAWNEWRDERIACARAGVRALVAFLVKEPAALEAMTAAYEAEAFAHIGEECDPSLPMRAAVEALADAG